MRHQSIRFSVVVKNISMAIAFICVVLVSALSNTVKASNEINDTSTPVKVKFLGKVDLQPVYQIDIANEQENELQVLLKDDEGNIIYSEKVKEKNFSKKFQFNIHDATTAPVTLVLLNTKNQQAQQYQINNVQKVVEEVIVTRLR